MRRLTSSLLSASLFLAASAVHPVLAQDPSAPAGAGPQGGPQIHTQTIPPAEAAAAPSPYTLKLQYTGEAWDNAVGGLHTGTPYMQNIDGQFRVDTGRAFGWTGGTFFVEGFYNTSRSLGEQYVGAAQDPSVIDTRGVSLFRLYELYYDQNLGKTDLLFGLYDTQTEFGNTKPMDIFFNGAYAWTTTLDHSGEGLNGPSTYPNTSLAFRATQKLNDQWTVKAVVADGMADSARQPAQNQFLFQSKYGALGIAEVDYTPIPRTTLMAGYWGYTGKFDTQNQFNSDGSIHQVRGSDGGYIGAATRLYTVEGRRGLDGFVNFGLADATVNQVDRSLNFGLTFTGPLDVRPDDRLGAAVSIAGAGGPYKSAQFAQGNGVRDYETNFELTYRAKITSWLTVQPDIQYWVNPNFDPMLKNDLLFGVHFEIGHLFHL